MTVVVTRGETGEGVVEEVRQLMGPADVDLAKENSPERYVNTYIYYIIIYVLLHVYVNTMCS